MTASKNTAPGQILLLAGRAIFVSQHVESSLSNLCRMLRTSTNVNPKFDSALFGIARERTASLKSLKAALKEFGIDSSHYLLPEIEDFVKRRDWLAHRSFIDCGTTREATREFQKNGLDELIAMASRLLGVILAVSQLVAEEQAGVAPLASDHVIQRIAGPHRAEARAILQSMKIRSPMRRSPRA